MRRHLTYANVLSLIVIVLATAGTTYAAKAKTKAKVRLITSAQIKDGTIASVDVRNSNLQVRDIDARALASMRGRKGATGPTGPTGGPGPQGATGDQGKSGEAAHSLIRHASYVSALLKSDGTNAVPNPNVAHWYADDGNAAGQFPLFPGSGWVKPNINESNPSTHAPTPITFNEPVLVQLTGNNHTTTGTIRPRGDGLLTATATVTVLHQNHGATFYEGGTSLHGRMRCRLRYADNGESIGAGSKTLGSAEWVSSFQRNRLNTFTITGSEPMNASLTSNYNVGVSCADVDQTNSNQWTFVGGSITAHAIWVGPA